jgi:hypothetical protein
MSVFAQPAGPYFGGAATIHQRDGVGGMKRNATLQSRRSRILRRFYMRMDTIRLDASRIAQEADGYIQCSGRNQNTCLSSVSEGF